MRAYTCQTFFSVVRGHDALRVKLTCIHDAKPQLIWRPAGSRAKQAGCKIALEGLFWQGTAVTKQAQAHLAIGDDGASTVWITRNAGERFGGKGCQWIVDKSCLRPCPEGQGEQSCQQQGWEQLVLVHDAHDEVCAQFAIFNSSADQAFLRLVFLIGRSRMRFPVAAKMAFNTAGAATAMVGSPTPPQKPPDGMMTVSTFGISSIFST